MFIVNYCQLAFYEVNMSNFYFVFLLKKKKQWLEKQKLSFAWISQIKL